jgi:plasmid rolling circle replication initiator protein Rep
MIKEHSEVAQKVGDKSHEFRKVSSILKNEKDVKVNKHPHSLLINHSDNSSSIENNLGLNSLMKKILRSEFEFIAK